MSVTAPSGALIRTVTIVNTRGLHARAAAKFVRLAAQYDAAVTVANADNEVSALSIMGLMMLAAGHGSRIRVSVQGADGAQLVQQLVELFDRKFDES